MQLYSECDAHVSICAAPAHYHAIMPVQAPQRRKCDLGVMFCINCNLMSLAMRSGLQALCFESASVVGLGRQTNKRPAFDVEMPMRTTSGHFRGGSAPCDNLSNAT